jgi:hypothetical protein
MKRANLAFDTKHTTVVYQMMHASLINQNSSMPYQVGSKPVLNIQTEAETVRRCLQQSGAQ